MCQAVRFREMFPASLQPRIRSLEKGALSFEVRGEEGAGLRWRGRGRFPEVGAGRGSPGTAASEVSAGAGSGCGTGRRGRDAGCGFSAAGAGGSALEVWWAVLRRGGVRVPGGPWIWQSVTQFSNFCLSGVEAGPSGPASLQGASRRRPRIEPRGCNLS